MPSINQIKDFFMFWRKKKQEEPIAFEDIPIIQLGVGGPPSSGKTVLIDALFRLMGAFKPDYVRNTNLAVSSIIELKELDIAFPDKNENFFHGIYAGIRKLNEIVSSKFHSKDLVTDDTGVKDENTYKALLCYKGEPKVIILVRNISGEMFNTFFSLKIATVSLKQSVNDYYGDFVNEYMQSPVSFKKRNEIDSEPILVQKFIEFIKSKEGDKANFRSVEGPIKRFFFAFCFFRSSDYFIYAIDESEQYVEGENEGDKLERLRQSRSEALENADRAIRIMEESHMKSFYVITKIDDFFTDKRILNNMRFAKEKKQNGYRLEEVTKLITKKDYWDTMAFIYYYINDALKNDNLDKSDNLLLKNTNKLTAIFKSGLIPTDASDIYGKAGAVKDNTFFVTVAYHKDYQFIPFSSDSQVRERSDFTCWHPLINNARMPLGVLELWLRLLHELGFDLKMLNILPSIGDKKYDEIFKKVKGIPKTS